ncbi:nicotinate-nucleotide adenylyltransferase [Ancylothrix sp. C2]|uniref:nicotinate-nucleotide adenylyltransferase n=1 Tax=Ancylothrix sp. D3o TaxID=2953691 RepID=UPI0021BA6FFD|nr:nicotinate-nucleotide adenylyltransferase [Ancylothrix sp. D3o]MCT7951226.1 nicotinate-nucleotide adenylyltransferase [Ancylothrix sp. D3o]
MTKIALFGTSADPPTTGHQKILTWLSQHFDSVAVWASDNPFKAHQTPLEHRQTMLWLLIEHITPKPENITLYPDLSHSRTIITVEQAKQKWPQAEFTLVIGSDLLNQLPRWYRAEDLLQQVKLLIIPRPGYAIDDFSRLQELREKKAKFEIASIKGLAVSSTEYREKGASEVLTAPVEDYIHKQKLYV